MGQQKPRLLYTPTDPGSSQTQKFINHLNTKFPQLKLKSYPDLYEFSIADDTRARFWKEVWYFCEVIGQGLDDNSPVVDVALPPSAVPQWFPTVTLSWAENMLRHTLTTPDKIACYSFTEPDSHGDQTSAIQTKRAITLADLNALVGKIQRGLKDLNVGKGDRVGIWGANSIETFAVVLAASSIGSIISSVSGDFSAVAVAERFGPISPKVIFISDGVIWNGQIKHLQAQIPDILSSLPGTTKPQIVVVPSLSTTAYIESPSSSKTAFIPWTSFLSCTNEPTTFLRLPFSHPLFILFSSGTTGTPKAIVHSSGGILLQLLKEQLISLSLSTKDIVCYYTTTGWMMANWLWSTLATGASLVLYEGSPLRPSASVLWDIVDDVGMTVLGVSAKFIESQHHLPQSSWPVNLRSQQRPGTKVDTLEILLSTGSPLSSQLFEWVYDEGLKKKDLLLGSMSGGTDICSCFAGVNTTLPVYSGEVQSACLGMAVVALSETALRIEDSPGELVCKASFPSQPVGFWPLKGYGFPVSSVLASFERYHASYFPEPMNGWWYHGDLILSSSLTSGIVFLGRSDGVLNPSGIRFGSSELYDITSLAVFHGVIVDSLAVGQRLPSGDERVVLFLKMYEGRVLDRTLEKKVKEEIIKRKSKRFVPERIVQVIDIPLTISNKKVEVPIKKILNGMPVAKSINRSTLQNPECIDEYVEIGEMLRKELHDDDWRERKRESRL